MKRTSSRLGNITTLGFMVAAITLTACANLQRSSQSGYAYTNNQRSNFSPGRQSYDHRFAEENDASTHIALKKAEQVLEGRREREQYFTNKPYMRNDRERLYFLSLDSFEDRERWMNSAGIGAGSGRYPAQVQSLIDNNDIAIGFTKQAVRDSWGEPELIEVAGNPMYGNERWYYSEQTSSTEGYRSQRRIIYFDSGRVSGWESH